MWRKEEEWTQWTKNKQGPTMVSLKLMKIHLWTIRSFNYEKAQVSLANWAQSLLAEHIAIQSFCIKNTNRKTSFKSIKNSNSKTIAWDLQYNSQCLLRNKTGIGLQHVKRVFFHSTAGTTPKRTAIVAPKDWQISLFWISGLALFSIKSIEKVLPIAFFKQ